MRVWVEFGRCTFWEPACGGGVGLPLSEEGQGSVVSLLIKH